MTKVAATQVKGRVLYKFSPNISFEHKDDFGNILCAYEKGLSYTVREGNVKLDSVVQKWLVRDAKDSEDNYISVSDNNDDGNLKLVRLGE